MEREVKGMEREGEVKEMEKAKGRRREGRGTKRERKERGDLPDQCQTASYAPGGTGHAATPQSHGNHGYRRKHGPKSRHSHLLSSRMK